MTQDDMVKVARECGIGLAYGRESIERFYTFVAAAEREKVAAWMHFNDYTTGHGDTAEDLLKELEWQVAEREREALGDIILDYAERDDLSDSDESLLKHLFELIRAREE